MNLAPGQTATIGVVVDNVTDLYSVPMLLQYNPAIISVEEVRHGGFLSGGTQEIAIVQRVDKEHGQAIISATRQPNTPGVNGSGTILGVVVKALAPGRDEPVDRAGKRQRLPAEGDSAGHQRSHLAGAVDRLFKLMNLTNERSTSSQTTFPTSLEASA